MLLCLVLATPQGQTIPIGQQKGQLTGTPTQIRLGAPSTLMASNGQLFAPQILNLGHLQAVANFQQNMPQTVFSTNQTAMLGNQPVYIRAATPLHTTQGLINPIQTVHPQRTVPRTHALVQPTPRAPTGATLPVTPCKTAQVQPTVIQPGTQQQRNVQRVKGLKQQQAKQPNKQQVKQPGKHSATEQHMATVEAAAVPRPPVQLKPKLPVAPPSVMSMGLVQSNTVGTSTATVLPTVLVSPTISPPAGSPMLLIANKPADKEESNQPVIADNPVEVTPTTPKQENENCDQNKNDQSNKKAVPSKKLKKTDRNANKTITSNVLNSVAPCGTNNNSTPAVPTIPVAPLSDTVTTETKSTVTTAPLTTTTISDQEVAAVLSDMKEEGADGEKIYGDDTQDRLEQAQANNNNILMHYIEGFIIEEGPEPFPVSSFCCIT